MAETEHNGHDFTSDLGRCCARCGMTWVHYEDNGHPVCLGQVITKTVSPPEAARMAQVMREVLDASLFWSYPQGVTSDRCEMKPIPYKPPSPELMATLRAIETDVQTLLGLPSLRLPVNPKADRFVPLEDGRVFDKHGLGDGIALNSMAHPGDPFGSEEDTEIRRLEEFLGATPTVVAADPSIPECAPPPEHDRHLSLHWVEQRTGTANSDVNPLFGADLTSVWTWDRHNRAWSWADPTVSDGVNGYSGGQGKTGAQDAYAADYRYIGPAKCAPKPDARDYEDLAICLAAHDHGEPYSVMEKTWDARPVEERMHYYVMANAALDHAGYLPSIAAARKDVARQRQSLRALHDSIHAIQMPLGASAQINQLKRERDEAVRKAQLFADRIDDLEGFFRPGVEKRYSVGGHLIWWPDELPIPYFVGEFGSEQIGEVVQLRAQLADKDARIAALDTELAKRPAAFVDPDPEPLKHNPFRDFPSDPRRLGG